MKKYTKLKWPLLAVAAIVFVSCLVSVDNLYLKTVFCNALIYSIVAYGLNLMLGMGGQVTFTTAGMMGIGAFVTGVFTTKFEMHPLLALLCSMVIVGLFSLAMGMVLFRLKGTYFTFATVAFMQISYVVMLNWREVTGGQDGITGVPPLDIGFYTANNMDKTGYIYILFVIAVICGLILNRIRVTSLGRALAAIRDNEITAKCMGINVYQTNVIAFVIAGVFAALGGSLHAHVNAYVTCDSFTFDYSATVLIMTMLGGVQSTVGTFLGAFVFTVLPEVMRFLQTYYKLFYGLCVMLMMIFMPMGFAGMFQALVRKISKAVKKEKGGR